MLKDLICFDYLDYYKCFTVLCLETVSLLFLLENISSQLEVSFKRF